MIAEGWSPSGGLGLGRVGFALGPHLTSMYPPFTGHYVSKHCDKNHGAGVCSPCEPGSYLPYRNGETNCRLCSRCREGKWTTARHSGICFLKHSPLRLSLSALPQGIITDERNDRAAMYLVSLHRIRIFRNTICRNNMQRFIYIC